MIVIHNLLQTFASAVTVKAKKPAQVITPSYVRLPQFQGLTRTGSKSV